MPINWLRFPVRLPLLSVFFFLVERESIWKIHFPPRFFLRFLSRALCSKSSDLCANFPLCVCPNVLVLNFGLACPPGSIGQAEKEAVNKIP